MRALIIEGGKIKQGPGLLSDKRTYAAEAGQSVFSVNYDVGNVDVYRNGLRLASTDFSAMDGETVELDDPCEAGDIVDLAGGAVVVIPGSYSRAQIDAFLEGKAPLDHTHTWDRVEDKPLTAIRWPKFSEVTEIPESFAPHRSSSSVEGGIKTRLAGATLYITNNGDNA